MKNHFASQILQRLPHWLFNVLGEILLVLMIFVGMTLDNDELTAWSVYLLGAVCLMRVWWIITRFIPNWPIRNILRLLQAALLLIPYTVTGIDDISWAPAIVMSAWEGVFMANGTFGRAGVPLLMITGMTILLYIVLELIWSLVVKPRWFPERGMMDQELVSDREELLEKSRSVEA